MSRHLALTQRTPEWLEARRGLITATDIPILLGLSPYKCEADLADEKLGLVEPTESTLRMRVGQALEPLIAQEYAIKTGNAFKRYHAMVQHPMISWAAASPDYRVVGQRRLVEVKKSVRSRFADGVPQDIEAQVAWQLGVSGFPVADIAVLIDDDVEIFEQPADDELFDNLVEIASGFRARLASGGPFARDHDRIKRDYPADDGSIIAADADLEDAVHALLTLRSQRKDLEAQEELIEDAIKARMADAAKMTGAGFEITWKRTKDVETTDWKSIADGLLRQLPETERTALVGIHTTVRPGFRPFRVVQKGD